jgi:hypothetical protein
MVLFLFPKHMEEPPNHRHRHRLLRAFQSFADSGGYSIPTISTILSRLSLVLVPSHHHRDHAGGVDDYVAAGAMLVVPEVARELYNLTGRVTSMATYTDDEPFEFKDGSIEFRSFWREENPHARDWSFSVATRANPSTDDDVVSHDIVSLHLR